MSEIQKSQLSELYQKRKALYQHEADLVVDNDQSIEDTVHQILMNWKG